MLSECPPDLVGKLPLELLVLSGYSVGGGVKPFHTLWCFSLDIQLRFRILNLSGNEWSHEHE